MKSKNYYSLRSWVAFLTSYTIQPFFTEKIAGPHFHSLWSGDTLMYFNEKA